MSGFLIFVCGLVACGAAWYAGYLRGKRQGAFTAHVRGQREGLGAALATAELVLHSPKTGKPHRSIVGRAIVRKLRALAEGTGE